MKYTYKFFSLAAIGFLSLVACNSVDDNDRFIELPAIESERVVLLEEFTGQKCSNCPTAHETIETLRKQYGKNLIAVSIHSDNVGTGSEMEPDGLLNAEGAAYCAANNVYALPSGIVNRSTSVLQDDKQWATHINKIVEQPAQLDILLEAQYDESANEINVVTKLTPYANISGNLQLWIVEDSITAIQTFPTGRPRPYTHNNVFRGTINGLNGESVSLPIREEMEANHTIAVKDFWNLENISVVGFVYNTTGVLQATRIYLNNKN